MFARLKLAACASRFACHDSARSVATQTPFGETYRLREGAANLVSHIVCNSTIPSSGAGDTKRESSSAPPTSNAKLMRIARACPMPSRGIASRAVNRRPVGSVARNPQTLILHAWRCYRSLLVYVAKGVAWRAHRAGCVTGGFLFFFSLCFFFDCRETLTQSV